MIKRILSTIILLAYCALLVKIMIFKDVPLIRVGTLMINFGGSQTGPANLVPFKTILVYLLGEKGLMIGGINLIGNIVLLLPVGLLIPLIFQNISWKKMTAVAVAAGFAIEGMQVMLQLGIFDIDDVILNGLGVMTGYSVFTILANKRRLMKSKTLMITAAIMAGVAAIAIYGFAFYQNGRFQLSFEPRPLTGRADQGKVGILQSDDPCGGTGGTGKIVSRGNHSITIMGRRGVKEIIMLTDETTIRSAAGPASESDLKMEIRVTIVTMESDKYGRKIANAVLICNASKPEIP